MARALGLPAIELDALFHQPGWTPLPDATFRDRVTEAVAPEGWVVDGNYSAVRDIVWDRADTVVWLDLPFSVVMGRTIRRTVRRVITREELWNGNREPWTNLCSFKPEKSIIAWSATRYRVYRRRYAEAEEDPRWAQLRFVRLRTQRSADAFLAGAGPPTSKEE